MLGVQQRRTVVSTASGRVRGLSVTSKESGAFYYSFQGIPYAQPPVGPLRFKPPQPVQPWADVKDCYQEGNPCIQYHMWMRHICGSEDCLYLNVYSPRLSALGFALLPVMVFIHGGGFTTGSGGTDLCGPDFLVKEQIVVVTINYRVNMFGFLTLEEPGDAQGNMGLKDQVEALKWVQANIGNFGGDAKRVTIVGESAGGASVHLHMLSPMSKGLFQSALSQSGVILSRWASTDEGRQRAFRLGEYLGCKTTDSQILLRFLRSVSAEELVRASSRAFSLEDREYYFVISPFPFVPTIEKTDGTVEPFMAENPVKLLNEGHFFRGPFLVGVNDKEGILAMAVMVKLSDEEGFRKFEERFPQIVSAGLKLRRRSPVERQTADLVRTHFLKNKPIGHENVQDFVNVVSDLMFIYGFHSALKLHSKFTSPYVYQFSYAGDSNAFKQAIAPSFPGACHGDEMNYLFKNELLPSWSHVPEDSPDVLMRNRLVRLWTNFVKTGNPTPKDDELLGVRWKPTTRESASYLDIGSSLKNTAGLIEESRMNFWDTISERLSNAETQSKL